MGGLDVGLIGLLVGIDLTPGSVAMDTRPTSAAYFRYSSSFPGTTSISAHKPVAVDTDIIIKARIRFVFIVDGYKDKVTDIFPCPAFRKVFNSSNVPYSILPIRV